MMIDANLERMQRIIDAATMGPWRADWEGTNHYEITSPANCYWVLDSEGMKYGPDLDFCAAARTDWPACVEEIKRLRALLDRR